MAGFIKNLQVRTNQLYKQSREVISSVNVQLNKQGKHNVLDPMNEAMINYGLVSTLKEINKIAGELEVLVEVAQRKLVAQDSKITDDAFKALLNKDTQGLYKLEWFKYEKESELRDAEKRLREENVRYEERMNDLTKHEEYK
ncbi:MAG: hypothetical protein EOM23_07885, partial [Candidatus Moranbacteria bacterium]|nr:hypothetical protein [Candidatus Moranbacteria bacterium]